jgi:hypothetical protein
MREQRQPRQCPSVLALLELASLTRLTSKPSESAVEVLFLVFALKNAVERQSNSRTEAQEAENRSNGKRDREHSPINAQWRSSAFDLPPCS